MRNSLCTLALASMLLYAGAGHAETPATSAPTAPLPLDYFLGAWHCDGVFPGSGKTISSTMRFERDAATGALIKHHDDTPPASYHAFEVWSSTASEGHYNAAIVDNFGGVRDFNTQGWQGDELTWNAASQVQPRQQFVYTKLGADRFRVNRRVAKKEPSFVVGDTLTCKRDGGRD